LERNILQLVRGSKSFAQKILFENDTFSVNEDEKIGVIGPNGAGKSTLFKIITGDEALDNGELIKASGLRIATLKQESTMPLDETALSYISRMSGRNLWEILDWLPKLRLNEQTLERKLGDLSGGYRMRIELLSLLASQPDLLLLDEPTNYLDIQTLIVLEELLVGLHIPFLLISHDREFLRRTTDHILEVEGGNIVKYPGSIDDFFEEKTLLKQQLLQTAKSIEAKKKTILDFVARFGAKATKARQAQSRLKMLDKMESIDIKPLPQVSCIAIPDPRGVSKIELRVHELTAGYADCAILKKASFDILTGDRVAIVGQNGAGKSTLLKTLAGRLPPIAGNIEQSQAVSISYYAQHVAEELDPSDTIELTLFKAAPNHVTRQEVLDLAGSLLFSGDDIKKYIRSLSGGEKARVALGKILLQGSTVLLLDEPTNHLDFYTVEALAQSLAKFKGTVVLVSHDQTFVKIVATKIIEVKDGSARVYHGSYDDYIWSLRQGSMREQSNLSQSAVKTSKLVSEVKKDLQQGPTTKTSTQQQRDLQKQQQSRLKSLQKKSIDLEKKMTMLSTDIAKVNDDLLHAPGDRDLIAKLAAITIELESTETSWIEVQEESENLKKSFGENTSS